MRYTDDYIPASRLAGPSVHACFICVCKSKRHGRGVSYRYLERYWKALPDWVCLFVPNPLQTMAEITVLVRILTSVTVAGMTQATICTVVWNNYIFSKRRTESLRSSCQLVAGLIVATFAMVPRHKLKGRLLLNLRYNLYRIVVLMVYIPCHLSVRSNTDDA